MLRIFTTDCEGPASKNDNAYEVTSASVPEGDKFFALVSKYDDVEADIVKRSGYKAGDTLKLIAPFLKAYEVTNKKMVDYSRDHIILVPGAKDTLQFVDRLMPSAIVSTSYEQYIRALCNEIGFPFKNTYCTKMDIDSYAITDSEIDRLKEMREEIVAMPMIEIPEKATNINDFSERDKKTIKRLDEIFWKEISRMRIGRILRGVNPIGGVEKTNAVKDFVARYDGKLKDTAYWGDSITDVNVYRLVNENCGVTVSFNGNAYAIREAAIAVLSKDTKITSEMADAFCKNGKEGVINFVKNWEQTESTRVELITDDNRERLSKESSAFRKTVRGEAIGKLG